MKDEMLIVYGGEVKSLGGGKIGGQLITFGDALKTDLEQDFFDDTTDYDVDFSSEVKSSVYYNHGTDPILGKKKLGGGIKGTLSKNEVGIWIEAQLDERNEYESAILELVNQKKMGWSSGTASHLVEREAVGKSMHIKKWTLGIDASLTPTPAEYRNTAVPLKSIKSKSLKQMIDLMDDDENDSLLGTDVWEQITMNGLCSLWEMFMYRGMWSLLYSDLISNEEKIQKINDGFDQLAAKGKAYAAAVLGLDPEEMSNEFAVAKSLQFTPEEKKFKSFREQIEFTKSVIDALAKRAATIDSQAVKTGAAFNAKNKEYLMSVGDELVKHGTTIKELVAPMPEEESDDAGKSIKALELKFAEHRYNFNKLLQ